METKKLLCSSVSRTSESAREPRKGRVGRRRKEQKARAFIDVIERMPQEPISVAVEADEPERQIDAAVGPAPRPWAGLFADPANRGHSKEVVSVRVPGILEASIERSTARGERVVVQMFDGGLATQGLVHGLSSLGWRVELKEPARQPAHRSKDRRRRENPRENRDRVERTNV
jgi:hypothetical protein